MKKISAEEVLWNKIKDKHVVLVERYRKQGNNYFKFQEDLSKFVFKVKGIHNASQEVGKIDAAGKATEEILWKKIEPVQKFLNEFTARQLKYISSKEMEIFANKVNDDFVERMEAANRTIHINHYTKAHAIKILMAFDKEIDDLLITLSTYEKHLDDNILEFEEVVKQADFTEN
jgi:predicted DNA binding protein